MPKATTRQPATQPAKPPPKADPRVRFDVPDEDRARILGLYLAFKAKEQDYQDAVSDLAKELKVGEGMGKVSIQYRHETGRFLIVPAE